MIAARSELIYDVGFFDGADTTFYLSRGYQVVAIDANPLMACRAKVRFAKEIEAKRLSLLNVGIAETSGTAPFWISDHLDWSSFHEAIASRDGVGHRAVSVPVMPFSEILAEYGIPHYLKVDIEGSDSLCINALRGNELPRYLSVESECVGDSAVLSDDEAVAMLSLLRGVGYRRFKLVNQCGWIPVRPAGVKRFCQGIVNGAAQHPRLYAKIASRFTDAARLARLGFVFTHGATGPWGEDIPGDWMNFETARSTYLNERRQFFSIERPLYSFWYDWHATY